MLVLFNAIWIVGFLVVLTRPWWSSKGRRIGPGQAPSWGGNGGISPTSYDSMGYPDGSSSSSSSC